MSGGRRPVNTHILRAIGVVAFLIALGLSAAYWTDIKNAYTLYRAERLITESQSYSRTTIGRLTGAPYAPFAPDKPANESLGRAQVLLLRLPDSAKAKYLQSLVDIGMRNWPGAAQKLSEIVPKNNDVQTVNALGVVFLQLADRDPTYLFRALDVFEQAEKLKPKAPEPYFNRLLILRRLHLSHQQENEQDKYAKIERAGNWQQELSRLADIPDEQITAQLQTAVDRNDDALALKIYTSSPEVSRTAAMRYGMNPAEAAESEKLAVSVGTMISKYHADETVSAMLLPLRGNQRSAVIAARKLVGEGASYFLQSDLKSSLEAYQRAAATLQGVDSSFDQLWLELNRAITEIRLDNLDFAETTLDHVVTEARAKNFKWLLASALSAYGSLRKLNSNFSEMMDRLDEAIRICDEIAAPKASVRARYFVLGQRFLGGDPDGTLKAAIECLRLVDASEHLRIGSVLAPLDVVLYKKGFFNQAQTVGDEAVWQASQSHNPAVLGAASTFLAEVQELTGRGAAAEATLSIADKAAEGMEGKERVRLEVAIDNTRARVLLDRGKVADAVSFLDRSRQAIEQIPSTSIKAETLTLLGQAYTHQNSLEEARKAFQQAVDAAERDNNFATSEHTKLAFDDGRRELYDSAIGFEYEHGSKDAAWTYLQHYRAKTFIEILAAYNPDIEKAHSIALDRSQVQKAIPPDMQVVEYALLPDRVLIWVMTNDKFETRSVPIARADVEEKVQDFLADLRAAQPAMRGNTELYNILIGPVVDLLQNGRPVAIIPDRALHGLPFGAIRCPENRYLIEYYPIIESPTLTHLLAADSGHVRRDTIVTFGSRNEDVAENREIDSIKTIYRTVSPFTGEQVTRAKFLDEMERAVIFHYAGHSARDASDPLRSAILLDGDKGGPNNVTAVDIVGRKLRPHSVVILSSCDSSVGNSKDGVGIRGLTSAFLVSGASAVVGSLWPVESTSTSELMIGFHRAFATEQLPIGQALRKAQLAFITANPKRSHPYYWSGFVVTSNFSALR